MLRAKLIDCGGGNISSAYNALVKMAPANMEVTIINEADALHDADYVILPGQGEFKKFMNAMRADGWIDVLEKKIIQQACPLLGICVGMQVMLTGSVEHCPPDNQQGYFLGLDWVQGIAKKLDDGRAEAGLKIPQMGWNNLEFCTEHPIFNGIENEEDAYFVHSYGLLINDDISESLLAANLLAVSDYGGKIAAIIGRDNFVGMQFHAEKSHHTGLRLIENFLRWQP